MKNLKTSVQHCALIVAVILVLFAGFGVGSVAALSDNEFSLGDVYTNYLYSNNSFPGLELSGQNLTGWNSAIYGEVSFVEENGKYYIADSAKTAADSTLPGTYSKTIGSKTYIINVKYPSVTLIGKVFDVSGPSGKEIANLLGGTANTDNGIYIDVSANSCLANDATIALTNPDKTFTNITGPVGTSTNPASVKDWDLGEWTIVPVFTKGGSFSKLAPSYMYGEGATFTLISADTTKKLEASADEIAYGRYVTIILTAPYGKYHVGVDDNATISAGQPSVEIRSGSTAGKPGTQVNVKVGTSGVATFVVQSLTHRDFNVTLYTDLENETIEKEITVHAQSPIRGFIVSPSNPIIPANRDTVTVAYHWTYEITNNLTSIILSYGDGEVLEIFNGSKNGVSGGGGGGGAGSATKEFSIIGTYVAYMNATFSDGDTISKENTFTVTKELVKLLNGWNVVSVPQKLDSTCDTAAKLFCDVDTAGHPVLSYNAQTKNWEQVTASTIISPLNAYWIYSNATTVLHHTFSTTISTPAIKDVYKGWNAVGLSAKEAMSAAETFGNTDWYAYLEWDAPSQEFKKPIIKGGSGEYADTNLVSLWIGGWLYVDEDGTLIGFTA